MKRNDGRLTNQLRPIKITYNVFEYAAGSVLFEIGKTKVLCAVNMQNSVPPFLKGKKTGWLSAEYAMLPASTHIRSERELNACKRNGRSQEISRLIGRSLRSIIDFDLLGERTIVIDCDVLQADGGTRTACITGAFIALKVAVNQWVKEGVIANSILKEEIAAVSIGIKNNSLLLDLDFAEDSSIDADFNIVMTKSGNIVEIQGSTEKKSFSGLQLQQLLDIAQKSIDEIFALIDNQKIFKPKAPFNPIRISSSTL